jgi:hypothetical protein
LKRRHETGKCIDPELFHRVFSNVVRQAHDSNVPLTLEVERHLEACSFCREQESRWRETAQHDKILSLAQRVVTEGLQGQTHVPQKRERKFIYFFGESPPSTAGGYYVVWDPGRKIIVHIQYGKKKGFREFPLQRSGMKSRLTIAVESIPGELGNLRFPHNLHCVRAIRGIGRSGMARMPEPMWG